MDKEFSKIERATTKLFRAKEKFEDMEYKCDKIIEEVIGHEVRTFVEYDTIRFEIAKLQSHEIKKIAKEIEEKTHTTFDGMYSFEFE